jgi:translation initiation factor 2B subunit (eIF-2B alpha/beta/delta family)
LRFEQGLAQVQDDRTQGAAELARESLRLLVDSALTLEASTLVDWHRSLLERAQRLAGCRPSMAAIRHLIECWQATEVTLDDRPLDEGRRIAAAAGRDLIEQSRRATEQAAEHLAHYLGAGRILMTHSLSSTIVAVFTRLAPLGVAAIVTESRPLQEGYRLAERLSTLGVPTTLMTDVQMGLFVARADAVIVGADSRCPDGSLINKAGTYLLALAARDQGIPFYVCSERFKQRPVDWGDPEWEQMDPGELGAPVWAGVTVANEYFDRTPARLISAWFDEHGRVR